MSLSAIAQRPATTAAPRSVVPRRDPRLVATTFVLGLVLTVVAAWHNAHAAGSWTSQVSVLFLAPQSPVNPNALAVSSDSIVTTAGVVGRIVDPHVEPLASSTVTITGRGVRHGFTVELPNTGGQNANNFVRPELDVQAVGSSAVEAVTTLNRVVQRIRSELAHLQASRGVRPHDRITTSLSPPTAPLFYERGSRLRALAATLLLGTGLSCAAALCLRRVLERRRRPA